MDVTVNMHLCSNGKTRLGKVRTKKLRRMMPPRRYRIMPLLLLLPQMLMPFFVLNNMTDIPGRCSLFQTFFYLASLFYLGRVTSAYAHRK